MSTPPPSILAQMQSAQGSLTLSTTAPPPPPTQKQISDAIKAEVDSLTTTYKLIPSIASTVGSSLNNTSSGFYTSLLGIMRMPILGGLTPDAVNGISISMKKASFFKFTVDPAALTAIVTPIDKAIESRDFPSKQQYDSLKATMLANKIGNNDANRAVVAAQNIIGTEIREKAEVENMKRRQQEEAARKQASAAQQQASAAQRQQASAAQQQASAARASAAAVAENELTSAGDSFVSRITAYDAIASPAKTSPVGRNLTAGQGLVSQLGRDLKDAQKAAQKAAQKGGRRGRSLSKRPKRSTRSKRSKSSKSSRRSKSSKRSKSSRRSRR